MKEYFALIAGFINTPSPARAFAMAMIVSMALTQWSKFLFPAGIPDAHHRLLTMLVACSASFLIAFGMWPTHHFADATYAFGIGLSSPILYHIGTAIAYRFWPWLEPILSARPRTPSCPSPPSK